MAFFGDGDIMAVQKTDSWAFGDLIYTGWPKKLAHHFCTP